MKNVKFTTLPDLSESFRKMKLLIQLERDINTDTILGYALKLAFMDKTPPAEILATMKSWLEDNPKALQNVLEEPLLSDIIITFNLKN